MVTSKMLEKLRGRKIMVWCRNFIYSGVLTDYDEDFVEITDPFVVYETGALTDKTFKDAQPLPQDSWLVFRSAAESIGIVRDG